VSLHSAFHNDNCRLVARWHNPLFFNAYCKRDYHGAPSYAVKINLRVLHSNHRGSVRLRGNASQRAKQPRRSPGTAQAEAEIATIARPALQMRFDPELVGHLIDGLRKAGLEISRRAIITDSRALEHDSKYLCLSRAALS
jgi:hypothetical protein